MTQHIGYIVSANKTLELLFLETKHPLYSPLRLSLESLPQLPTTADAPPKGLIPEGILEALGGDAWPYPANDPRAERPELPALVELLEEWAEEISRRFGDVPTAYTDRAWVILASWAMSFRDRWQTEYARDEPIRSWTANVSDGVFEVVAVGEHFNVSGPEPEQPGRLPAGYPASWPIKAETPEELQRFATLISDNYGNVPSEITDEAWRLWHRSYLQV